MQTICGAWNPCNTSVSNCYPAVGSEARKGEREFEKLSFQLMLMMLALQCVEPVQ